MTACLQREIKEETGIDVTVMNLLETLRINIRATALDVLVVLFACTTMHGTDDLGLPSREFPRFKGNR
ncbi:MAG: NUDIX hydrolase [Saprospiraceae bacterium]